MFMKENPDSKKKKKPVFFHNIFSGDLHFNALVIRLCQIFPIIGLTLGESTICLLVYRWRRLKSHMGGWEVSHKGMIFMG